MGIYQFYLLLKSEYPDHIVFVKVGDFYEAYGDDAKIVSRELTLALSGRRFAGALVPMCAVVYHELDRQVASLVMSGFMVHVARRDA